MKNLNIKLDPEVIQLNTAKKLLTIQSYIEAYYNVDLHETGKLSKKFVNVFHLGLVLRTYHELFGPQEYPVPYRVYAKLMERERTTAWSWQKRAISYLQVYEDLRKEYQTFLEYNRLEILKDCRKSRDLADEGYIKIVKKVDTKKLA